MTDSEKLDMLLSEMLGMKSDIQGLKSDMQNMKQKVSNIELTLEGETNPNIKVIAEGHLDLSRKLDKALMVEGEKEMLIVRVNIIENELRKVKEQLAQTA